MKKGTLTIFMLVALALTLVAGSLLGNWLTSIGATTVVVFGMLVIATFGIAFILFWAIDRWYVASVPQNYQIGTEDGKKWWQSKLFWLGLLQFVQAIVNGIAGEEVVDEDTVTKILGLDWNNLIQAIMGLAVILVRKYLTFFPIKKG